MQLLDKLDDGAEATSEVERERLKSALKHPDQPEPNQDIQTQLNTLQKRNIERREALKDHDWYERACVNEGKFRKLSQAEARAYLVSKYQEVPWFLVPGANFFLSENDSTAFDIKIVGNGLDPEIARKFQEKTGRSGIEVLVPILQRAASKYRALKSNFGFEYEGFLKLEINEGKNFSSSAAGGDLIYMGGIYLDQLLRSILDEDYKAFKAAEKTIEAQYFHEFIHLANNNEFENDTIEELTLLAELLYDPLFNIDGNDLFNRYFGTRILDEENLRGQDKWSEAYDTAYKQVTSKILLYELYLRGKIKLPLSFEDQKLILTNISEYYCEISEEERDEILRKYLPKSKGDLYDLGKRITEEIGLSY